MRSCAPTTTTRVRTGRATGPSDLKRGQPLRWPRCLPITSWILADGMAETVAKHMPSAKEIAANSWLPDAELRVYSEEFARTGFQGGLNWYRSGSIGAAEQQLFAGRTIDQPSIFISGASDWGSYQSPGALERMQDTACTDMRGVHTWLTVRWALGAAGAARANRSFVDRLPRRVVAWFHSRERRNFQLPTTTSNDCRAAALRSLIRPTNRYSRTATKRRQDLGWREL